MDSGDQTDISIHALCEEGDASFPAILDQAIQFLSTPSARRATEILASMQASKKFLSTPSARRATLLVKLVCNLRNNFYPRPLRGGRRIGQLRDSASYRFLSTPSARRATVAPRIGWDGCFISIHALCEEGDSMVFASGDLLAIFLSTPSARRATRLRVMSRRGTWLFLSTPSARRATRPR